MKKIDISIITVNYNVEKKVLSCIKSLVISKSKINFEIIVVDNSEFNSLKKFIKKFPNIKYIKAVKNLGFGAGNNLGARYAKGKYLFFLNPDTLVVDDAIDLLYEFIKSNKKIGIVSPLLVDKNLKPFSTQSRKELTPLNTIYSFSFLRKLFPKKSVYNDPFFNNWDKKQPIEVETIPGAALMISKKLFERVNGFDEQFFLYFEENDLSKRVRGLGFKLYVNHSSRVIHEVGQSTKNIKNMENIYKKSRYLYLKKHYGIVKAIFTELILRINKISFILFPILLTSLFLRTVNLHISMPFIGDQGWFYLSARDLLINGEIPLVGITSSHTWLHQGPLWTYMLSVALFLGNFNPISGGILTAIFGVGTTFLIYKLGSEMFSKRIGIIASSLYSVSPLIVFFERMPFDPSVVPFFTILYFYTIYKWVMGGKFYFTLIIIFLTILYNLELATFSLFFPFLLIFFYGLFKKRTWISGIFHPRIIAYSLIGFTIVMAPIIIYDFANGFKQTVVFLGWVFIYKPFSFLFGYSQDGVNPSIITVVEFLLRSIQRIVFEASLATSIFLFCLSTVIAVKSLLKKNNFYLENPKLLLLIFLIISIGGILVNKSPSDAYLPITFPLIILLIALFFDQFLTLRRIRYIVVVGMFILLGLNFHSAYKNTFNPDLVNRIKVTNKIIALTKGQEYNLIGKGQGSQFESFTMNFEYLLWWKGFPVSDAPKRLKIILSETPKGVNLSKIYD